MCLLMKYKIQSPCCKRPRSLNPNSALQPAWKEVLPAQVAAGTWELGTHGLGEELVCGYSSIRNFLNDKWQVLRSSKRCLYRKIDRNHVGKWGASAHLMQLQQPALWLLKVFCAGFSDQFGKFLSATFIVCSFVYKQLRFVRYRMVSWVVCKMNY